MYVNRKLIIGTIIIIAAGIFNATHIGGTSKTTITRILVGGYIVALLLAVADLFQPLQQLSGAFLLLAVTTSIFTVLPDLATLIQKQSQTHA